MKTILKMKRFIVNVLALTFVLSLVGCNKPTPEQIAERTELLFKSIRTNDVEMAKQCIKTGANVNALEELGSRDGEMFTPLIYAIQKDCDQIVELLIKSKADVNFKDPYNKFSPAVWALRSKDNEKKEKMLRMLANAKADLSTGFFYAGKYTVSEDDLKLLKNLGANINAKDEDGWTPLMVAASTGALRVVTPLVDAGADVNYVNENGESAITVAAESSNWSKYEVVSYLTSMIQD